MHMTSYLVQIKKLGDEKSSSDHVGGVRFVGPMTVQGLLAGILSVSRVGHMSASPLTAITVTAYLLDCGPVTPDTE
jgi:hypothetical protein